MNDNILLQKSNICRNQWKICSFWCCSANKSSFSKFSQILLHLWSLFWNCRFVIILTFDFERAFMSYSQFFFGNVDFESKKKLNVVVHYAAYFDYIHFNSCSMWINFVATNDILCVFFFFFRIAYLTLSLRVWVGKRVVYSVCLDLNGNKYQLVVSFQQRRREKTKCATQEYNDFAYVCIACAPYTKRSTRPHSAKKLCLMRDYLEREAHCSKKRDQATHAKWNKTNYASGLFSFVLFCFWSRFRNFCIHIYTFICYQYHCTIDMVNANANKTIKHLLVRNRNAFCMNMQCWVEDYCSSSFG